MATYVAVFALVLAYLAVVAAYAALRTLAKVRRDTRLLSRGTRGPNGRRSLIEVTRHHADLATAAAQQVQVLRDDVTSTVAALRAEVQAARADTFTAVNEREVAEDGALRHVALVRYDAFGEMSGRMSFSLALLDDRGDGVAVSAITGRTDTRMYAKAVSGGSGEHDLSPEERQAVDAALGRSRRFRRSA